LEPLDGSFLADRGLRILPHRAHGSSCGHHNRVDHLHDFRRSESQQRNKLQLPAYDKVFVNDPGSEPLRKPVF